jgi:hypothetical protein
MSTCALIACGFRPSPGRIAPLSAALLVAALLLAPTGCEKPSGDDPPPPPTAAADPQPAPVETSEGPAVTFVTQEHDFGAIWDTEDHPCAFQFTNTGDATLRFLRITSSCTCTLATLDKWEYAPGESGQIDTTFEPTKAGEQTQAITLLTNAVNQPAVKLAVHAAVSQFLTFDTKFVRFGSVERYREHRQRFNLICAGRDMVIEGIESTNAYVSAAIVDSDADAGRATIEVTLADDAPWGLIRSAKLDCTVSGRLPDGREVRKTATIRAIGSVLDEIRADVYSMSVGVIPPGRDFTADAAVYHVAGEPFEIAEASIRDAVRAEMSVSVVPDQHSARGGYRLVVSGTAGLEQDLILGVIEFRITSRYDPAGSIRQIPIIGKIGTPQR